MGTLTLTSIFEQTKSRIQDQLDKNASLSDLFIAKINDRSSQWSDNECILSSIITDDSLLGYIGGEDLKLSENNLKEDSLTNRWFLRFWGRRVFHYLVQFQKGYYIAFDGEMEKKFSNINQIIVSIDTNYSARRLYGLDPKEIIIRRKDVMLNINTFLDPSLFSCLIYYEANKLDAANKEFTKTLLAIIKREIGIYTNNGESKNRQIIEDESTIWWGIKEILLAEKLKFRLGQFKEFEGAVDLCLNYINDDVVKYPEEPNVFSEQTFEIHGKARTFLFIIKNLYEILNEFEQNDVIVPDKLYIFFKTILTQTLELEDLRNNHHIYFTGLSMEVLGYCIAHLKGSDIQDKLNYLHR